MGRVCRLNTLPLSLCALQSLHPFFQLAKPAHQQRPKGPGCCLVFQDTGKPGEGKSMGSTESGLRGHQSGCDSCNNHKNKPHGVGSILLFHTRILPHPDCWLLCGNGWGHPCLNGSFYLTTLCSPGSQTWPDIQLQHRH